MIILIAYLSFVSIAIGQCTFVTNRSSLWQEEIKQASILYKYLSSEEATPLERYSFIKAGIKKYFDFKHAPTSSKPVKADTDFDCKIKELAYEYAKKLNSNADVLKFVFDGLELGAQCNQKPDIKNKKLQNKQYKKLFAEDTLAEEDQELVFYVDNSKENSNYISDGSFSKPFWVISEAVNKCKNERRKNDVVPCSIKVRAGKYFISQSLKIDTDNISLENFKDENVVVSSDKVVQPQWILHKNEIEEYDGWNPMFEGVSPMKSKGSIEYVGKLANDSLCQQHCMKKDTCTSYVFFQATVQGFASMCYLRTDGMWNAIKTAGTKSGKKILIYKADLSHDNLQTVDQVFVNGRRAIRARFPNANPETMGLHTVPTGYVSSAEKWLPPQDHGAASEIHIQSPNRPKSLFPTFYLGIGGPVNQFDPPKSYWGVKSPVGGGGATYRVPSGLQYSADLEIANRTWKNPSTGIVHSLQHFHWGNWMYKLDSRDMTNRQLKWTWGGFQEARGSNDGQEWYVENIFEELDSANEWFYDESTKMLYYSPNVTASNLPKTISIPQLSSLLRIVGSQSAPRKYVKVSGMTFEHSTQTFLKPYLVPSGGDWSVHRDAVVFIEGTENVQLENSVFDSPGGNGIFVSNYNRGTVIKNNLLYRLGDNGITAVGEAELIDGTNGNQPRGLQVIGNTVLENGIWGKQTYAFVQSKSCETLVEGNIFFNGPRAGININDGFGGGNQINRNLLFNFVRETDDHGPINTWDRVPYITKVNNGTPSLEVKENQIHRNLIINNYRSVWPIDHDDGTCFWNDTYNFMVYGGFKNYLGHNLHSLHNIYVRPDIQSSHRAFGIYPICMASLGQSVGTAGYGDAYMMNKCILNKTNIFDLGGCQVEHLTETIPLLAFNEYHVLNPENVKINCGRTSWSFNDFKKQGMEVGSKISNLVQIDQIVAWGKDLLQLQ